MRRVGIVDRVGRARQDHTLGLVGELRNLLSAREHLREDVELAQAAGNQMTVLGTVEKIASESPCFDDRGNATAEICTRNQGPIEEDLC